MLFPKSLSLPAGQHTSRVTIKLSMIVTASLLDCSSSRQPSTHQARSLVALRAHSCCCVIACCHCFYCCRAVPTAKTGSEGNRYACTTAVAPKPDELFVLSTADPSLPIISSFTFSCRCCTSGCSSCTTFGAQLLPGSNSSTCRRHHTASDLTNSLHNFATCRNEWR